MAANDRPGIPAPAGTGAVQVRPPAALSTWVMPAVAMGADDEAIHFRDLWRVVVKRKWVVIAVFLIVLATALVATMMTTPIYRATITLKIEREASKVVDFKGGSVVPEEAGDLEFYRTQYELLKSRSLAERVVAQLNLRAAAAAKKDGPASWWSGILGAAATPATRRRPTGRRRRRLARSERRGGRAPSWVR